MLIELIECVRRFIKSEKGDSITDVLLITLILVFVIFPVASSVLEKYIAMAKGQEIQDALDITNVAVYNSLNIQYTGTAVISFNTASAMNIYRDLLAQNLKLNSDLTPKSNSIAEGPVQINELILYTTGFPSYCSKGRLLKRPAIHSYITVPVKPTLYRAFILQLMGKEYIELKIHVDTELPINN